MHDNTNITNEMLSCLSNLTKLYIDTKRDTTKIPERIDVSFDNIVISVDPAISEKTKSDSFAIVIIWKSKDCYYIIESIELIEKQKDPFNATIIVKELYHKYKANYVIIETVAFQQVMSKLFKNEWLATKEIKPHKDKITRVLEKQFLFEQWKVYFKNTWNEKLINQLLDFPNIMHDDLVDWFTQWIEIKEKKKFIFESL